MTRRSSSNDEPGLFDLPLGPGRYPSSTEPTSKPPSTPEQASIDLLDPPTLFPAADDEDLSGDTLKTRGHAPSILEPRQRAPLKGRLLAGVFDLGLVILVGLFCILSAGLLGIQASGLSWPPFGVFLLSFSFLYHVIPLAFWGRTPGMAIAGLIARNADNLPLTIGQTGLRWLGTILTLALLGLPVMLLFTGASLTDRISGSQTFAPPRST